MVKRRDPYLSPSREFAGGDRSCVTEAGDTTGITHNDPLPKLSVSGCTVYYAGVPIHEAESPEAAVVYRDRHIDLYA